MYCNVSDQTEVTQTPAFYEQIGILLLNRKKMIWSIDARRI